MAKPGAQPRLADHLASFGREPEQPIQAKNSGLNSKPRPGTEVDLGQFGLGQR